LKRFALLILASVLASCSWAQQQYTRGIGVYPGDPSEYTGPAFAIDGNYRNLALHRPAYQSSAYDYNLTAQLVTDGIKEQTPPQYVVTSTSSGGILPKQQREVFLDGNITSSIDVTGDHPWVEFDLEGGANPPELDRIDLWLRRMNGKLPATGWTYIVSGSDDHTHWTEVGRSTGAEWPSMHFSGPSFMQSIPFTAPARNRYYRVDLSADGIKTWGVAELATFDKGREVHVAGPEHFLSAWMSPLPSALPGAPAGPNGSTSTSAHPAPSTALSLRGFSALLKAPSRSPTTLPIGRPSSRSQPIPQAPPTTFTSTAPRTAATSAF
jgi:hypothetical protein